MQEKSESNMSDAAKAELQELEERLEKAVEEEDYDSADIL